MPLCSSCTQKFSVVLWSNAPLTVPHKWTSDDSLFLLPMQAELKGFCVALRLAKHVFLEAGAPQSHSYCREDAPWAPVLLRPHCPLIARKFPENTASQVRLVWQHHVGTATRNMGAYLAQQTVVACPR